MPTYSDIFSEINDYLGITRLARAEDPLKWWKINASRFCKLSNFAKRFLSGPPSSVRSERVFSTAGDVIDEHRARLLPEKAEMLIFLKVNENYVKFK